MTQARLDRNREQYNAHVRAYRAASERYRAYQKAYRKANMIKVAGVWLNRKTAPPPLLRLALAIKETRAQIRAIEGKER